MTITDTVTDIVAGPRHPRFPLAGASSLDERLRMGRERQHFSTSIENGPPAYFLVMIAAAEAGDDSLALAAHERLKKFGWLITEIEIPPREGRSS
jgi:hypothetical protein